MPKAVFIHCYGVVLEMLQAYLLPMGMTKIVTEIPEDALAAIDKISVNKHMDRGGILREALDAYLEDHAQIEADLKEADLQIEAGDTVPHEDVVAWLHAQHARAKVSAA